MSSEIDLVRDIIDLKIREAVGAVMGEVGKLAQSYNELAVKLGPLQADYDERKREQDTAKDATISQQQQQIADLLQRISDLKQLAGIKDDAASPGAVGGIVMEPKPESET